MEIPKLVRKSQQGDKIALKNLIERLSPIRKAICAKFPTLPREDLEQDLILIIIEALKDYKPGKSTFQWYVKQKSHYYALDQTKKRKLELEMTMPKSEDDTDPLENLTDGMTLEDIYEIKIKSKDLIEAIKTLDPKERYIIYFYYFRDYSLKEIGEKLNLSQGTISKHKTKALRKLKRNL